MFNPHIHYYSCLGDYLPQIIEAHAKKDLVLFNNLAIASTRSINFRDGAVMNRWLDTLLNTLNEIKPNIIYIEETVVLRNAQTQRFLTRLQGVVYAWCIQNNCEFNTIRPSSWRKAINLKQNKNIKREQLKQEAIDYVKEKYNIEVNDDIADAICIGDAVLNLFNID